MASHPSRSLPMPVSPHLDVFNIEPKRIPESGPHCAGYLDTALTVFERHNHPFLLVSNLAMRWHGANHAEELEIDVLVRASQIQAIVDDLVASGDWEKSTNYATKDRRSDMINETSIPDIWLKSHRPHYWLEYLRIWPEELYKLSVDCNKIEVPDIRTRTNVTLEEEYYRDPYQRFGPPILSTRDMSLVPSMTSQAKSLRRDIPIFVPLIEEHLNAVLDQRRTEIETGLANGNGPDFCIQNYIRYLYLDWSPAQEWVLREKVWERNRVYMKIRLQSFKRKMKILWDPISGKPVFDKMPWELRIRPEFLQQQS